MSDPVLASGNQRKLTDPFTELLGRQCVDGLAEHSLGRSARPREARPERLRS